MIKEIIVKDVIVMHPSWMLLFLFCYALSFYVYFKTCDLFVTITTLATSMCASVYIIYCYYNIN